MRRFAGGVAVGVLLAAAFGGHGGYAQGHKADAKAGELRVYFVDVEGGQATLFVGPKGETMLVDTGNPGGRDAGRIVKMCRAAGVTKIDNLVLTHYHVDHVGGLPEVAAEIPVGRFIDHGANREGADVAGGASTVRGYEAYRRVLAAGHARHRVVKPGDVLPTREFRVRVVSADGEVIAKPLHEGGEKNAACAGSTEKVAEETENDRSVGMVLTFGRLRILDLGDLTWAKERPLMCPVDKIGKVDVYVVSHHGLDRSGSPALVDAIAPRVAIMDNGPRKGGAATTFTTIRGSSRLEDLWALHTAVANDAQHNAAEARTANLASAVSDAANYLELEGLRDGSFAVINSRTGEKVEYPAGR